MMPLRVHAGRPLLDRHQWDAYFALFAQDVAVPWKATTVRLDTYSGAPVDFAAYAVDPAEVIVAGATRATRAIDTSKLQPAVRWRFSPPEGYRFETSDVPVPLGSSEGFYVIEARRGDATQQVWLNRTRIGLLTKESPEGLALWGVDLRTGRALRGMHVDMLVGARLVAQTADQNGLVFWHDRERPVFALAESGPSRAFVSLLPQAPIPSAIVGVRVESANVRAGGRIRVIGFARRRSGGVYRRASGEARVTLMGRGRTIAGTDVRLDAAGGFTAELGVPPATEAGDYALLANAGGAVGGTSLHVDAAADVTLTIVAVCPCSAANEIPLEMVATRAGGGASRIPLTVRIVRTPHVLAPEESEQAPRWGTTLVRHVTVVTDAAGGARVAILPPTDGLSSTYGISASTAGNGSTATYRLTVPTAAIALSIEADVPSVDLGQPVGFSIRGFTAADGSPASDLPVTVRLSHGVTSTSQSVRLDERGRAHVLFRSPSLGSNLATAEATVEGRVALDAASVRVAPSAVSGRSGAAEGEASVSLDRARYRRADRIGVSASLPGSSGEALVTLEGARTYQSRVAPVADGRAHATLELGEAQGEVRVSVAFVRDGAIALGRVPVQIDAPGHPRATSLAPDRASYGPGDVARVAIRNGDATGEATVVMRLTDGRPSGGADLDDIGAVLRAGGTSSQNPASESPAWHGWVAPAHSKAGDIFAADRPRQVKSDVPSIGAAAPRVLFWRAERSHARELAVPLPHERGSYVLSVLEVFDGGDVGAASASIVVR
jgi:hypothetical protein